MRAPCMHDTTEVLRKLCDIWERHGSGITNMHGSTGDIILLGTTTDQLEPTFQELEQASQAIPPDAS